jgi:integrase
MGDRGKGHIAKKGDKYYLVLSRGSKRPPKWVQMKATTDEEAEKERDEVAVDRRRNVWTEPTKITVDDFAGQFLADMDRAVQRKRKAKATYEWYEKRLRLHILPKIGGLRFHEVKARDLQNLYDDLYYESTNKAESAYRILHALWSAAVEDDDLDIKYNLADKIKRPDKDKYIPPHWTGDQITYFLQNAKERRYYEVFLLGFGAGMRLGEILGLTWDNIDHKNMMIHVKRSITLNKPYELEDIENLLKKTKTVNSVRTIRMLPVVSEALKLLKKKQAAEELACKNYYKLGLVFTTEDGRPVNYSNLRENYWKWLIDQLNNEERPLPYMKPHGMRHSCATWLYEMGVPIEVIQDILGHSVPAITKQLYVHPTVKAQDGAAGMLNDLFKRAGL